MKQQMVKAWRVEVYCCNTMLPSVGFYRVPERDGTFRSFGAAKRHARDWSGRRAFLVPWALYKSEIIETSRPRDFWDLLLSPIFGEPDSVNA